MIDLKKIPLNPGCYIYKDNKEKIIYIGKAKNLKNRVTSYFKSKNLDIKTQNLVKNIKEIDYIVTDSEIEALLLENNLIKKNKPKYNLDLKDSKSYTYIKLTKEKFPRFVVLRTKYKDDDTVFGPFTTAQDRDYILKFINKNFKLRTCKRLPKKPCFRYYIEHCDAPCINNISEKDYNERIKDVKDILSGKVDKIINKYEEKMKKFASDQKFENALLLRNQLNSLYFLKEKQNVERKKKENEDIINYIIQNNKAYVLVFNISKGLLLNKKEFVLDVLFKEEFLSEFVKKYYSDNKVPSELILPEKIDQTVVKYLEKINNKKVKITVPQKGEKKNLLDLSYKNINITFFKNYNKIKRLQEALKLKELPRIIECFDISHFSGKEMTASMVQFQEGVANKSQYRRFKIDQEKIDDFKAMETVVTRRYQRQLKEENTLPNLIVIDGGKGQLSSAVKALESLNPYKKIPIISIAKKEEEIFFPNNLRSLKLKRNDPALHLVQEIRDESHRFAINYNKLLRSKKLKKDFYGK